MTHIPNMPPEMAFATAIDDLYGEAGNWLDGTPLANQAQADAVGQIMAGLRTIRKDADAARKVEKRPHDDAAKAVQDKWLPILTKADRAIEAAQRPLTDWLARQEAERIARETAARAEAERLAQQAAQIDRTTLDGAEASDAAIKAADAAQKAVTRIAKGKSHVAGDGRAIGLRTHHETELSDAPAALRWLREHRPQELREAILALVKDEPLAIRRSIPGITINETRKAA